MKRILWIAAGLAVLLALAWAQRAPERNYVGSAPAIEFPEGLDWINTTEPLALSDLRGKIVLLDFWTYGCINCVHVIPDLKALQEKYPDELVVIGVHSAKFSNEGETENIRLIAERYGRSEPIVNDRDFKIWRSYGMNAWPSFILIDPEGKILGRHSGEGIYDLFDGLISGMINVFEERGTLKRSPLKFTAGSVTQPRAALRFPGAVLADEAGQRLFIADSSNHRIVITDFTGQVLDVIGSGNAELTDGDYATAAFTRPQGMTLETPDRLYVADTGNHSLRLIDLQAHTVTTIAGNGQQEYLFNRDNTDAAGGLNSPWDVLWVDGQLFIAMAGQHQIWRFDPTTPTLWLHAGSGREELKDGPLRQAGLNQPSGLATDGRDLFIADSEASAVRRASLNPDGELQTLVGTGLFDFGDVDGTGNEVRLQHPKAVAYAAGNIFIADTYNNRIKQLDPEARTSTSVFGSGEAGWLDSNDALDTMFHEPGGLSIAGDILYIADTNNHLIRLANLRTGEVSTLTLSDPDELLLRRPEEANAYDEVNDFAVSEVQAGDGLLEITLSVPPGYRANHLAPLTLSLSSSDDAVVLEESTWTVEEPEYPFTLSIPARFEPGSATVTTDIVIYYCRDEASELCLIRQAQLLQPVTVTPDATSERVSVNWQPPPLPPGY